MEFTYKYGCHQSIKGIGMIRRMKASVPQSTVISVYNSLIVPHFDYCSLVWNIGNAYSLEKLQKLQNRAAIIIIGKSYDVRSKDTLEELSWQPLMKDGVIIRRYLYAQSYEW